MNRTPKYIFQIVAAAAVYYAAARLSLLLAFENTNASPVWPPSAIGFALILFAGRRFWPAVAIGTFLANVTVFLLNQFASYPMILLLSAFIAAGNTLEALIGVYLLKHLCGERNPLDRLADLKVFLVIVPAMCLASSLIGSTTVALSGNVAPHLFLPVWLTWWIGDATGILAFAPLIFSFYYWPLILKKQLNFGTGAFFILVTTAAINLMIFSGRFEFSTANDPYDFLFVPLIVWAAFHSNKKILAAVLLITCGGAVWGTVHGYGPFVSEFLTVSLLSLQVFVGILAVTGMVLYTVIRERWQDKKALAEKEYRYRQVIDSAVDAFITISGEGRILEWNKVAEDIFGWKKEEVLSRRLSDTIIPPKHRAAHEHGLKHYRATQEGPMLNKRIEITALNKAGAEFLVELAVTPIQAGGRQYFTASLRDLTLPRQVEAMKSRIAAIVGSSEDAIVGKSLDGVITDWNAGAERIYGYSAEEAVGRHVKMLVPEGKHEELDWIFRELRAGRNVGLLETIRRTKGGKIIDVALTISLIKDAEGKVLGASAIGRDITVVKQAQNALREREEWFRSLIENSSDLLILTDPAGQITYISPSVHRILGYTPEERIGRSFFEQLHPDDVENVKTLFGGVLEKPDEIISGEARNHRKDGSWAWFEGIAHNLLHEPNIRAIVINCREITEQKLAREQLRQYNERLQESNKELEQFAFVASHDLQEPLRIISSYVHLLSKKYKDHLDAGGEKYINYVVSNTARMQEMINSLLEYSRLGRDLRPEETVDTAGVCDQAVENLSITIKNRNAIVEREDLPVVTGRKMELLRLFQNLINNAIKYCDKKKPLVRIKAVQENEHWVFAVEDNGIGIEEEYFDQIFDVFKRLHTKEDYSGSGMGLAICKKIVEHNRGRIWVESAPGKGSCFYFTIPIRKETAYEHDTT